MKENIQRKKLQRMTCIYHKTQKKVYRSLLFWTIILHWDTKEYKRSSDNKGSTHAKIDYALTFGMPKKPKIFSLSFTKIE